MKWADGQWTPQLGLDLEGGTQIVLQPVIKGGGKVDDATLRQSVDIIRARIDGSGVGEAEITTEGGRNIVVAVPGKVSDAQRRLITQSSQLQFRPVLAEAAAQAAPHRRSTATSTPSGTAPARATPKAERDGDGERDGEPDASTEQGRRAAVAAQGRDHRDAVRHGHPRRRRPPPARPPRRRSRPARAT